MQHTFGEPFQIIFRYKATENPILGFACHIANHTGLRITGQTHPKCLTTANKENLIHSTAGESWTITYFFHGGLWPGTYVIGGGILDCCGDNHGFVHRVLDIRALRVLEQPLTTVVGTAALQASETILRRVKTGEEADR